MICDTFENILKKANSFEQWFMYSVSDTDLRITFDDTFREFENEFCRLCKEFDGKVLYFKVNSSFIFQLYKK